MHMDSRCLAVVLGLSLAAAISAPAVEFYVAADKPVYYQGEQVKFLLTVTTPGTLMFYWLPQTYYTLDGRHPSTEVALPVISAVTVPPGGYTWSMTHNWSWLPLTPGVHTVTGMLMGYGASAPCSFNVVQAPQPHGNFLVDFDTIPGTSAPLGGLVAYDAIGVHFHTALGAPCTLRNVEGDSWIEGFDPYPDGFNVAASFDWPVFGATAQVAGGTGARITLMAKNAAGQTLATATTPAISQPGQFAQTLTVFANEPIAALEWRPDMSNSVCAVDNLYLATQPGWPRSATPPTLTRVVSQPDGSLLLQAQGTNTFSYTLHVSSDLANWTPLTNLIATPNGTFEFLDRDVVGQTTRFYRLSCP
jgi:hypothetical protein